MKTRQSIIALTTGIIIGTTLTGPVATAAENWLKATPSTQQFFVDGQRVELEAYAINGNNYVKLRDIAKAVDFGVSYDPMTNSVIVVSGVPYIADRMTYSTKVKAAPDKILAQDEVMMEAGSCMTYSTCLSFLCEQAGIPCILIDSYNHQWNMVYVDGQWWQVDPTAEKVNIQAMDFHEYSNGEWREVKKSEAERQAILEDYRDSATVLQKDMGTSPTYMDEHSEMTRFLQELLVPNSTLKN